MPRVGVNLRASAYLHQGDRKYMEDEFVAAYQRTADKKDIEYAFFGIFDGHGGKEAAHFAKDHLMDNIVSQKAFWSADDGAVLDAIREGFIQTHMAMWKVVETWPRTASGWPSTSGSTASVAFIRKQKIYIGHVGDSGICLGYEHTEGQWLGEHLTKDHKPESSAEKSRINRCGGKVVNKSGVPRVVWNRPKRGHKGPVRRSTPMDEIPFLAVARSLGDLWSYNPTNNQFVVSPLPDVHVYDIDFSQHRCLIFGTDGLWNVMSPFVAVNIAYCSEKNNENHSLGVLMACGTPRMWVNPSRSVVKCALDRYNRCNLRADNTSAVVVFLDPPGKPKREVLLERRAKAGIAPEINTATISTNARDADDDEEGNNSDASSSAKSSDPPSTSSTSTLTSSGESSYNNSSQVKVNVYNINTKEKMKSSSRCSSTSSASSPSYGTLRLKERMAEKWQVTSVESPSVLGTKLTSNTPVPRSGMAATLSGKQAPTPGATDAAAAAAAEENLKKLAADSSVETTPVLASMSKRFGNVTPQSSASLHRHVNAPSPLATNTTSKSLSITSSHPSLRSTLKRAITSTNSSVTSSPSLSCNEQGARLSLVSDPLTPTTSNTKNSPASAVKTNTRASHLPPTPSLLKASHQSVPISSRSTSSLSTSATNHPTHVSNKSVKRDLEDKESSDNEHSSKKICTECGSSSTQSLGRVDTSNLENNRASDMPTCTYCNITKIHNTSMPSSPKSTKSLKLSPCSQDIGYSRKKSADAIQSPVISSSSSGNISDSSPLSSRRSRTDSNSLSSCTKNLKLGRRTRHNSAEHIGISNAGITRVVSSKRLVRTRSGVQTLSHKSPLKRHQLVNKKSNTPLKRPQYVAEKTTTTATGAVLISSSASSVPSINNNVWSSSGDDENRSAKKQTSNIRSSNRNTSTSISSDSSNNNFQSAKTLDSHAPPSKITRAVLKSVNRGSPIESSTNISSANIKSMQHQPLRSASTSSSSSLKSSKYAKTARKKSSLSVPSLPSLAGLDTITAPPPKKKSAKMYLRSGKSMITRSQEKVVRPK